MKPTRTILETAQDLAQCGYPAADLPPHSLFIAKTLHGGIEFFRGDDTFVPNKMLLHTVAYVPDADEILAALFVATDGNVEVKLVGFHAGGFRHRVRVTVFSRNTKCIGRGASLFEAAANCWCNLSEQDSHPELISVTKQVQFGLQNKKEQ